MKTCGEKKVKVYYLVYQKANIPSICARNCYGLVPVVRDFRERVFEGLGYIS